MSVTSGEKPLATEKSRLAWERAARVMPGGVHNPAFYRSPYPVFYDRSNEQFLYDLDGNARLDLSAANTALPLGNNHPRLAEAIVDRLQRGSYIAAMTEDITVLAEVLVDRVPSYEKVMFTDSGSKATHYAVRLARAFTGRPKFAKPFGGFHGGWDGVLYGMPWRYGADPNETTALPGVSPYAADEVVLIRFNDLEATEAIVRQNAADLGSIILEPVIGDGYLPPAPGFLEGLRSLCDELNIVLIFDEVVTFGVGPRGAQGLYGVMPDLATTGKIVGGGMPIGVVGGRADIMALADPRKGPPVPFGATFGGHPLSMVTGLAQLELLTDEVYARLKELGDRARSGVDAVAAETGVPISATGVGHLFNLHWNDSQVVTYEDHCQCDHDKIRFFESFLSSRGYLFAPGVRCDFTYAMTDEDVDGFVDAIRDGVRMLLSQDHSLSNGID